jgi:hypothetical protein
MSLAVVAMISSINVFLSFVFGFAGTSLVYVPITIVVFTGTASLEGGDCDCIPSFTHLRVLPPTI